MSKQPNPKTISGILLAAGRRDLAQWYANQYRKLYHGYLHADKRAALAALERFGVPPSSGRARPWTDTDLARLRELAAQELSAQEIADQLGRTPEAVHNKAKGLEISLRRDLWTDADIARLRELAAQELSAQEIAGLMGRTAGAVLNKARGLEVGLTRPGLWSDVDDARLRELVAQGVSTREIADLLERTPEAVLQRARKLRDDDKQGGMGSQRTSGAQAAAQRDRKPVGQKRKNAGSRSRADAPPRAA